MLHLSRSLISDTYHIDTHTCCHLRYIRFVAWYGTYGFYWTEISLSKVRRTLAFLTRFKTACAIRRACLDYFQRHAHTCKFYSQKNNSLSSTISYVVYLRQYRKEFLSTHELDVCGAFVAMERGQVSRSLFITSIYFMHRFQTEIYTEVISYPVTI